MSAPSWRNSPNVVIFFGSTYRHVCMCLCSCILNNSWEIGPPPPVDLAASRQRAVTHSHIVSRKGYRLCIALVRVNETLRNLVNGSGRETKSSVNVWDVILKLMVCQVIIGAPPFTEPECSGPCSQETTIGLYPEPVHSGPPLHALFPLNEFSCYTSNYALFPKCVFPSRFSD
jgi:hypothetical protein